MSCWSHIVAAIYVDTCIESKELKTEIETLLEKAPKITGSEDEADVFVNVLSGYNESTFNNKEGEWVDFQSCAVITIVGDLRDRTKDQTEKEWLIFKEYIENEINNNGFLIRNYTCIIQDNLELLNYESEDDVEIIRCKDCKHAYINSFSEECGVCICNLCAKENKTIPKQYNDFCSYGERKNYD